MTTPATTMELPCASATRMLCSSTARLFTHTKCRRRPQGLMKYRPLSFHVPTYLPNTVPTASWRGGIVVGIPSSVSGQHAMPSVAASGVVQQKKEPVRVFTVGTCVSRASGVRDMPLYGAEGGCSAPYAPGGPSSPIFAPSSGVAALSMARAGAPRPRWAQMRR